MKIGILRFFVNMGYSPAKYWVKYARAIHEQLDPERWEHRVHFRTEAASDEEWIQPEPVSVEMLCDPRWVAKHLVPRVDAYRKTVIHFHSLPVHNALWVLKTLRPGKCITVMTDHDPVPPQEDHVIKKFKRRLSRYLNYYPDHIIAISQFNKNAWERLIPGQKVTHIYNGIEIPPTMRAPRDVGDSIHFLYLGRMMEIKGVRTLINHVCRALKEGHRLTLELVGGGPDAEWIKNQICTHDVGHAIQYHAHVGDVRPFYERADVVIIPSLFNEPMCKVSLEAQALGIPCIYARRGGMTETQIDGVTGICFEPESYEDFVAAMLRLQKKPDLYRGMIVAGRKNVEERFSITEMAKKYADFYERVIEEQERLT